MPGTLPLAVVASCRSAMAAMGAASPAAPPRRGNHRTRLGRAWRLAARRDAAGRA